MEILLLLLVDLEALGLLLQARFLSVEILLLLLHLEVAPHLVQHLQLVLLLHLEVQLLALLPLVLRFLLVVLQVFRLFDDMTQLIPNSLMICICHMFGFI